TACLCSAAFIMRKALRRASSRAFIAVTMSFWIWSSKGISCYSRRLNDTMHIRKQRLLTPGPTPLYPPALHAMMASDLHHRTEDFRKVYRSALADLKEVMGTSHDVLMFAASGTGAMDASVSNLLSRGDKVIVCVAGKLGERWEEIAKAYGLDATVLTVPYGEAVAPEKLEAALSAEPAT